MERDSDAMFLGAVLRRARIAAGIVSQDDLAKVRRITDMLRCEALPRGASRELIMKVAKDRWSAS